MTYDTNTSGIKHYYGDIVRMLFLAAAILMLVGLPAISNYVSIPTVFSVISMLILGLAAGLTNPKQKWDAGINTVIASVGFVVFETYAVIAFREHGGTDKFFLSNLILGFIFLIAVYFSVKTLRGLLLKDNGHEPTA
jgi:hypothetical protein